MRKVISRLRLARQRKMLSQLELAQIIGCSQQMISFVEIGQRRPGPMLRRRLSKALNENEKKLFSEK